MIVSISVPGEYYCVDTTFIRRFVRNPKDVGSVAPSSRFLVAKMLAPVPWHRCRTVVELGPGTGAVTEGIVSRLPASAHLLLFERDPVFRQALVERFPQAELFPEASALSRVVQEQGVGPVHAVLSGLPFALFSAERKESILTQVHASLADGGLFIAFQYSLLLLSDLRRIFRRVHVDFTPLNLPPAFIYVCRK